MEAQIDALIDNLHRAVDESTCIVQQEPGSILSLVVSNALDYDSDSVRKLIVANSDNSSLNRNNSNILFLKEKLYNVSKQVSNNQFSAFVALKQLAQPKLSEIQEETTDQQQQQQQQPQQQQQQQNYHQQQGQLLDNKNIKSVELLHDNVRSTGVLNKVNEETEKDSLAELRSRLLSRKPASLESSNQTMENQNEMHQSKQDTLLDDVLGLVGQLRLNVSKFNESIENDTEILKTTTRNLEKVGGAANMIGKRLKVFNEKGKISFWFYIYVLVGLVVVPLVMLFIIRLVPRSLF